MTASITAQTRTSTTSEARALDDLVRAHLPLVGHLVREMLGRVPAHVSREDLVSAGMTALAGAAKSFDPARGTAFGSFAATRIRGALLDDLRGMDWASRSVRTRARKIDTGNQNLIAALGRNPTRSEVAESLGLAVDEVRSDADDVQRAVVLSSQGFAAGTTEDMVRENTPGPEELSLHRERIGYLHDAVAALPEFLRAVVTGYFFEERPMRDLAEQFDVTESRISQLRSEALLLLHDGMHTHLDPNLVTDAELAGDRGNRRRAASYDQIGANSDVRTRLAVTNAYAVPVSLSPRQGA